jgi:membrane associated rhomboid family serine protease
VPFPEALVPTTTPALLALAMLVAGLAVALWRRFPMSYTMALLSLGVFVLEMAGRFGAGACGLQQGSAVVLRADCVLVELSFIPGPFLDGQRLLTPFTYMFVHADILHIVGNMFILLTAGPALEERVGSRNFLLVYLAAGLAAAAATLGLIFARFPGVGLLTPNVGASGAIFGVLTAFAVLYPRERLPMMMPMGFFVFWMPSFYVLLLYLGFNLVYILSSTTIAWWGHFAGFLVGLAAAPLLQGRLPKRRRTEPVRVDVDALRALAHTHFQRSALHELQRLQHAQTPDDAALADVWWERFLQSAHCPQCHAKLRLEDGTLACPHGDYEVRALR